MASTHPPNLYNTVTKYLSPATPAAEPDESILASALSAIRRFTDFLSSKSIISENTNIANYISKVGSQLSSFISNVYPSGEPYGPETIIERNFLARYVDSLSTFDPLTLLPTLLAVFVVTCFLSNIHNRTNTRMSSWSRWANYVPGRFSPFTRSPASGGEVSDSAFSYITSDDLKRSAAEHERSHGDDDDDDEEDTGESRHHHHHHKHSRDTGSSKKDLDTDVLILRIRREQLTVHFPAYSIDRGELRIGDIRAAAAKKANTISNNVRLFYKGRNLKDDARFARDEGFISGRESELLCVVGGDPVPTPPQRDDSEDEDGEVDGIDDNSSTADGGSKRKKRKPRKKKPSSGRGTESASNGYSTPPPTGTATFIPPSAIPRSTTSTPAPSSATATPQTPLDKINTLDAKFRHEMVPLCSSFVEKPPSEKKTRDFEHKKLSETIMGQVLLKLDGVEVEGDMEARMRRKEVIRDVQGWLNKLDDAVKA